MKIAILGASHWHVPLMYIPALNDLGEEIVAVADTSQELVDLVQDKVDCPRYTDYERCLAETQPDFVFAHAPHRDMTDLAAWLIQRHAPFHMEKPMGTGWRRLEPVATKAETEGLFCSVALVSRYYAIVEWLKARQAELGQVYHYYYRLFAGDPGRYRTWGVPWMLDPEIAGGGPLFNFGPHVVDLMLYLCTSEVVEVSARLTHGLSGEAIEDIASLTMYGACGEVGVGEVSYCMPSNTYERYFSYDCDALHAGGPDLGDMVVNWRNGQSEQVKGNAFEDVYPAYVKDTLERFRAGQPPVATPRDMVRTLRVMCAAQESAETRKTVTVVKAAEGCGA